MKKRITLVAFAVILTLLPAGCLWLDVGDSPASEGGTLRINLHDAAASRSLTTILPPVEMTITDYLVTVERLGVVLTREVAVATGTTTFVGLQPGEWNVTVEGRSGAVDPIVIARDTAAVTIIAGQIATLSRTIGPVAGQGSLVLNVEWPDGVVASPGVVATLEYGGTVTDLAPGFTFDTEGDPDTASYVGTIGALETGYHVLTFSLTDGGVTVWGPDVASVRIIDGQTTIGTIVISESGMNLLTGSLQIDVFADLQNPYEIAFGQEDEPDAFTAFVEFPAQIASDEVLIVATRLAPADPADSYEWHLDGVLQAGSTGDTFTITGASLTEGSAYRLSLIVTHGSVLSSRGESFRIIAPSGE